MNPEQAPGALRLKERIFNCLPAGRYACTALLRLLDVVETDTVATAAVECRAQPRLLVNPGFVERHAHTPEKLMMLVMHELHHLLLGHTRRFATVTPADNLVMDAVINAMLCKMFPHADHLALFTDFYDEGSFPQCLLRPPPRWAWRNGELTRDWVPLPSALQKPFKGVQAAREVYQGLYSREGVTEEDLRRLLSAMSTTAAAAVPLLGDHDHSHRGEATATSECLARAVSEVVREWPTPPPPLKGQSLEGLLVSARLLPRREAGQRRLLRQLIAKVARSGAHHAPVRRIQAIPHTVDSPVPVMSRRSTVLRAMGALPLLHPGSVPRQMAVPSAQRVHVYLDVSGSMEGLRESIYGAALDCREWIHGQVHLFSTRVEDVSLAELAAGVCKTTGGTDIGCVTRHMAQHHVRRAIVVTDGLVGDPKPSEAGVLRRVHLGCAYVAPARSSSRT